MSESTLISIDSNVLKRMAYGFRDREFFKLSILAMREAKYALPECA